MIAINLWNWRFCVFLVCCLIWLVDVKLFQGRRTNHHSLSFLLHDEPVFWSLGSLGVSFLLYELTVLLFEPSIWKINNVCGLSRVEINWKTSNSKRLMFHPCFSIAKFSMVVDISFADFSVNVLNWSINWKHGHLCLLSLSKWDFYGPYLMTKNVNHAIELVGIWIRISTSV